MFRQERWIYYTNAPPFSHQTTYLMDYIQLITLFLAPITGIVSWFAGRRKRLADLQKTDLDTVNDVFSTLDKMSETQSELYLRMAEIQHENNNLKELINELRREKAESQSQLNQLKTLVEELRRENAELKNMVDALTLRNNI